MNGDNLRFAVVEGSEVDPVAFRAFGALCVVQRDFPGRCNSIVLVDTSTDEIVGEMPRDISPGEVTIRTRSAHYWWQRGYLAGSHDALRDVRAALVVKP